VADSDTVQPQAHGHPQINGETVTFHYAARPSQPVYLVGDFNGWQKDEDHRLTPDADGQLTVSLRLPLDAYVEYALTTEPGNDDARLQDPLNAGRTADNGMGYHNHYFYMPQAHPSRYTQARSDTPHGTVTAHHITSDYLVDGSRPVWFYQPPTDRPVPLVLVYDGYDYQDRGKLVTVVDNLIADGEIAPIALAMVKNAGSGRFTEYNTGETIISAFANLILPLAQETLNLEAPGNYGVLGASMGGLMALYTALRLPHIFRRIVSQSGAFLPFNAEAVPLYRVMIDQLTEPPPFKLWLDVGTLEWLHDVNAQLYQDLRSRGWDVTYLEYNAGHNYTAWANGLARALTTVFPQADQL
jgi:enterochelin esterase-like enzyme